MTQYYTSVSPEIEVTNLLDDGVMRLLKTGDITAVPPAILDELKRSAGFPVLKIDEPMCHAAVNAGSRIGMIASFPPTSATTRALLAEAAAHAGRSIEIIEEQTPEALTALLAGDEASHDKLLVAAADRLAKKGPEVIVLAQVSMARLAPELTTRLRLPVLSSLASSLNAARAMLNAPAAQRG